MRPNYFLKHVVRQAMAAIGLCLALATAAQDKTNTITNTNPNTVAPPVSTLITVPDAANTKPIEKIASKISGSLDEKPVEKTAGKEPDKDADKPPASVPHIALILPLNSKALGSVSDAIKQGFIAAATVDGNMGY